MLSWHLHFCFTKSSLITVDCSCHLPPYVAGFLEHHLHDSTVKFCSGSKVIVLKVNEGSSLPGTWMCRVSRKVIVSPEDSRGYSNQVACISSFFSAAGFTAVCAWMHPARHKIINDKRIFFII
ncbi:MAG: hypothetical protein ACXVPQ_10360 [Bacteroidia bacterium]